MKIQPTRILSVVLAAATAGSVLAGCQKTASPGAAENGGGKPATTMTVEVFDRGKPGQPDVNNNYWSKWINANFGKKYNVNVQFVSVPRSEEVDKLNVLMAANQAPDLCFTYDSGVVYNYVSQDGLTQLDDLLTKHGQNLTKYLGEEVLQYGQFSGKQYSIPGKRTMQMLNSCFIRKDWLDKLDMEVPTTRDEFYNMLVAFRDKNPGKTSTGCVPLGLALTTGYINNHTANLADSFLTDFSEATLAKYAATSASFGLMYWQMPGYKDYMQFMNKLYNEKLISPDFAIDKTGKQKEADASNGKVGVFCGNWDYIYRETPGVYTNLKKTVPDAEYIAVDCFKNPATGKYTKAKYATNAAYMIIPKSSEHAEQVVQYLNWMSDSKVTLAIQNGAEGVDYTMEDGVPKPKVPSTYTGEKMMSASCNGDYDMLHNGPETGSEEKNVTAIAFTYPGYEDAIKTAAEISLKDAYTPFNFTIPNSANAKYSKSLDDKSAQMTAKLISCKPSDFSDLYDRLVKEFMVSGGQAIIDENIKNYKTQTGKTIQ